MIDASFQKHIHRLGILVILSIFMFLPLFSYAQLSSDASISLKIKPDFPKPETAVTISLDDYSLETTGAEIAWYIDNTEAKEFKNKREIKVQSKKLGQKTVIKVLLSRPNTSPLTSQVTLIPITVDLILEAKTYTPYFYKGRALPSSNSQTRAIAVINDGTNQDPSKYSYKWSLGDTVLSGGAEKGAQEVNFTLPQYTDGSLIVEVYDAQGTFIGRQSRQLTTAVPELIFYEWNPLRGLSQRAISGAVPFIAEEITIYGEPYYLSGGDNFANSSFEWKINALSQSQDLTNAITLRKQEGNIQNTDIKLTVLTLDRIPQYVQSRFSLYLNDNTNN